MTQVAIAVKTGLLELAKDYTSYNRWANETLVNWLSAKPEALMSVEVASSFPSIQQTLKHLSHTQAWWLGVLKGNPDSNLYDRDYAGPVSETFDGLLAQSNDFVNYVNSLTEEELMEKKDFTIPYVGDFSRSVFEIIQHTMNHSTYHRGQVITIGRNVDITDAPMTDYMYYLLMV